MTGHKILNPGQSYDITIQNVVGTKEEPSVAVDFVSFNLRVHIRLVSRERASHIDLKIAAEAAIRVSNRLVVEVHRNPA